MGNMIFVVIGMFVLVWIVSAVMKASQAANPKPAPRPVPPPNRNRQNNQQQPQPEKTSNTDLERFMAEIDKLRTRSEAPPTPQPRPAANPQPQRANQPANAKGAQTPARPRGERRPANNRRTNPPPPLPTKTADVPVLRPVTPVEPPPTVTGGGTSHTLPGFKQAKLARTAASGGGTLRDDVSPVLKTLQTILKGNQGPAIAVILTEIFGEPRCRRKF